MDLSILHHVQMTRFTHWQGVGVCEKLLAPPHFPAAFIALTMVTPSSAGELVTHTPAASRAAILSCAPPLPPEMMAPACPIRRPGGAVTPAMNDTTGLFVLLFAFSQSAASSSACPPISPIMMIP